MSPKDKLPLSLRTAHLTLHRSSDSVFAKYGITADRIVPLANLEGGQATTQRELAARVTSDPGTVRAMLVLLENQGLTQRVPHPVDARARTATLTKAGLRIFPRAFDAGQEVRVQLVRALGVGETRVRSPLPRRVAETVQPVAARSGDSTSIPRLSGNPK